MKKPLILIIEDDPDGRRSLTEAIEELEYEVVAVEHGIAGVEAAASRSFDVVLSDLVLPDIDGIEVLRRLHSRCPELPVIIMTAYGSVSTAVEALKAGAYDYLTKPLDLDDIQIKTSRAVETSSLRHQVHSLKTSMQERFGTGSMIAQSNAMQAVLAKVHALAPTNATVLIHGESGTGKELIARALHTESPRATGPFVAVNCGAFTESLLESELFGHEKGAFTGATQRHAGAFERADGGTLLLDEIGDAPAAVQIKLLRVLEDRRITRIGGQESFHVDVRVVSATNQDLDELVEEGTFREDLLYRINVVTLHLPPLRQRREEIRPLAEQFIANACGEHNRRIESVEEEFFTALEQEQWPGNIRQLRNVVESAVIMCRNSVLRSQDLERPSQKKTSRNPASPTLSIPPNLTFEEIEREVLRQALDRNEGNRTLTADSLGLARRTIQRKIQEYNLPF